MLETLLLAIVGSTEPTVISINKKTTESSWHLPATIQTGEKPYKGRSLYRGDYYKKSDEGSWRCIRVRESNNSYHAINRTGKYRGAYQMSPELTVGAGWMIQKDLISNGMSKRLAKEVGQSLRDNPANKWHPFWQDYAFWLVWDHGNGKKHWGTFGQTYACY